VQSPIEITAMTNDVENLVLEHLRAIRGTLSDHGDRLNRIELRLSAIEQTLGSLYALSGSDRETVNALTRRVERIEQRLQLSEYPT
jgi:archaellum component FlaC